MKIKPFYNAISAIAYITILVFTVNTIDELETNVGLGQYIMPILVLSLLTLSVAVMGYIFFYQPFLLYMDGKKEKAVEYFLQTTVIFASIIVSIAVIYSLILYL